MERVAFLIEETGERITCLLNPESVVLRRAAGVRPRQSAGGQLTGSGLADDPLLYTGGGRTELECLLLFDVNLGDSTVRNPMATHDVRALTGPLWNLAENRAAEVTGSMGHPGGYGGYGGPRIVRFVWGKSWNVPGVVVSVAERLEHFTPEGVPQRSWLSLHLLRVNENATQTDVPPSALALPSDLGNLNVDEGNLLAHELKGGGEEGERAGGERLDQVARQYYGDASMWRLIAAFNNIADPMRVAAGTVLRIPPLSALSGLGPAAGS
jgi:hypothetical protein